MIDPSSFCSAPWFGVRLDWDGKYRPCCRIDLELSEFSGQKDYFVHDVSLHEWMTSEYSQYLRRNLSEGNRLSECQKCWKDEERDWPSTRQLSNRNVGQISSGDLSKTWVSSYLRHHTSKDYMVLQADVKLSNVCNYSCAMCNPHDSSKIHDRWQKEKNYQPIVSHMQKNPNYLVKIQDIYKNKRGHQQLRDILQQPIRQLKLLGGEPLLDKTMLQILESQPSEKKSQITLNFVTNGSQDLVQVVERLKGFHEVTFAISIEACGKIGEYMRQGSDWQFICDNIARAQAKNIKINVHCVLQALNAVVIRDFIDWSITNNISLSLDLLRTPEVLSLKVLPDHLRQRAVESLEPIKDLSVLDPHGSTINIGTIQKAISETTYHADLHMSFLEFIAWYEKDQLTNLRVLQPWFYQ